MCIKLSQDYTECGHYSTSITKCPTYHKQQQSTARSIINFLFGKREKRRHCGRLVPHHVLAREPFCEKCLVAQSQGLQGQQVGRGAVLVDRFTVDEDFRSGDRGKRAKEPRRRHSGRRHPSPDRKHPKQCGVSSKASVWLPDAYHAPERFAETESYRRSPAQAPPVSPPKASRTMSKSNHHSGTKSSSHKQSSSSSAYASRKTTAKDSTSRKSRPEGRSSKSTHDSRRYERETPAGAFRTPAFGDIPPLARPVEPAPAYQYQHQGRFAAPAMTAMEPPPPPPAVRLSPSQARRRHAAPPVPEKAPGPQLRRKPGKTFLNIRNQPLNTLPTPLPEYQVYLNAMPSLTTTTISSSRQGRAVGSSSSSIRPSDAHHYGRSSHRRGEAREEQRPQPRRRGHREFNPFAVVDDDDGSDLSFVCLTSRRMSETGRA